MRIPNPINTKQSENSEVKPQPSVAQTADKEDVVKPGTVVAFLPQVISESTCSGVFAIDGKQYKGQIDLAGLAGKGTKKQAEILRGKLKTAQSQNRSIPRFIIIGEPKNGVYSLKSL